jgi:multidomain signaling protein FimX
MTRNDHDGDPGFRFLFEAVRDPIGIALDGYVLEANQSCATLFGYSHPGELVGVPILDLIAPSSRAEVSERYRRRLEGSSEPIRYEALCRRLDGSEFLVEFRVSLFTRLGRLHTLVILRDITAEQLAL